MKIITTDFPAEKTNCSIIFRIMSSLILMLFLLQTTHSIKDTLKSSYVILSKPPVTNKLEEYILFIRENCLKTMLLREQKQRKQWFNKQEDQSQFSLPFSRWTCFHIRSFRIFLGGSFHRRGEEFNSSCFLFPLFFLLLLLKE